MFLIGCLISVLFAGLHGCSTGDCPQGVPGLRAAWVQARSIATPEEAHGVLARIEVGHLNAVFVNVFVNGYAYYESALLEKHPDLALDYDPLAYVVEQAHQRGIAVHTWLVAGPVGYRGGPGPILTQHPDWAMAGPDGRQSVWLNYTRPDVRQFIGDIVLEIVQTYDVDGVHFDYTRYPGPEWGFDPYSAQVFAEEYGIDLDLLRYSELPAYATFNGNSLAGVDTARVLAMFDDGRPAVLLNHYGAGGVILLNWSADRRQIAASGEILGRGIDYLSGGDGSVYILRSETNAGEYGYGDFEEVNAWLDDLGLSPIRISEGNLTTLGANGVLVMPNVYLINAQVASDLSEFVYQGGNVIFIDGPTRSIEDENIQAITGMRTWGGHFKRTGLLIAAGEHEIIPTRDHAIELEDYPILDAQWKTFRRRGIDELLRDVYQRVRREGPHVLVTVTVAADQQMLAEQHFLNWPAWLEGEYVDLIIPRAYVDADELLQPAIADWQPIIERSGRVAVGLKVFSHQDDRRVPKTPARMLSEIDLVRTSGSNGVVLFSIERIGDDVLESLATGPFSSPVARSN